jgi:hypothetical protein
MSYGLQVPGWFDNSWNTNTAGSANDLGSVSQAGPGAPDPWGDFFRGAAGALLNYGINRDAAREGIQTPQATPVYIQTPAQAQQNMLPLLLIAGAVVAVIALNK